MEGFDAMDRNQDGVVTRDAFIKMMLRYTPSLSTERADLIMAEIISDLNNDCSREKNAHIEDELKTQEEASKSPSAVFTKDAWCNYMASWLQVRERRIEKKKRRNG